MRQCMVPFCKNKGTIRDVKYYRLTSSRFNPWVTALGRNLNEKISPNSCVCSNHFLSTDFLNKEELLLKPEAVPSVNLRPKVGGMVSIASSFRLTHTDTLPSTSRIKNKESTKHDKSPQIVNSCNVAVEDNCGTEGAVCSESDSDGSIPDINSKKGRLALSSVYSEGLNCSPKGSRKSATTLQNYSILPKKVRQKVLILKRDKKQLRFEALLRRPRRNVVHLRDIVKQLKLRRFLSTNAEEVLEKCCSGIPLAIMKRIMKSSVKGQKLPEEIREFACTLHFYSSQAYKYTRQTFNVPLPAPPTVRRWLSNPTSEPGFTEQAFEALRCQVAEDSRKGKHTICSLMIDEMSIKKQVEYFENKTWGYVDCGSGIESDELPCATEALVLMVVAVNGNWKLPIAYFFINSLTAQEKANAIKQALIKLMATKVTVTSVTCDGPSANFKLAKHLGALIDTSADDGLSPYFEHPVNSGKVYVIFDACHMLKLLRNTWASVAIFRDRNDSAIDYNYVERLHAFREEDWLRFGNKLRKTHVEWSPRKMKANLAAQIFSTCVADAMEYLMADAGHAEFAEAGPTIKFIRLIVKLIDLLNSRDRFGPASKSPLMKHNFGYWKPILDQAVSFFQTCTDEEGNKMIQSRKKTPFLGFTVTIRSVVGIYTDHVEPEVANLQYLQTYKFGQDHLESFFSSMRSKNVWSNDLTAYQFYTAYKRMWAHHRVS